MSGKYSKIKTIMFEFSKAVCERIGYYVYILKDPRSSTIIYIGKGIGNRIFQHATDALTNSENSDKLNLIRDIHNSGIKVEYYILRHGLTEKESFEIESACIDLLGLNNLTNVVKGHYSWERGLKTVDEISQYYDAKIITITEPTIIININKLYKRFMTEQELYDITRSSWKVAEHRRKSVKYAVASYRGLVRAVYEIKSWNIKGSRWEFSGVEAASQIVEKYMNQSLDNYVVKGSQNPIKYVGG